MQAIYGIYVAFSTTDQTRTNRTRAALKNNSIKKCLCRYRKMSSFPLMMIEFSCIDTAELTQYPFNNKEIFFGKSN